MGDFLRIEDLVVYQRLCALHLEVSSLCRKWPTFERFELASQVCRSSNSAPANLAEKHSDRHLKNKIEGVNRARGESLETVHHLYIAKLKGYIDEGEYHHLKERYLECVRMLNGLERTLEQRLPESQRRWGSEPSDSADKQVPFAEP